VVNLDYCYRDIRGRRDKQTDRQTCRHADCSTSQPTGGKVITWRDQCFESRPLDTALRFTRGFRALRSLINQSTNQTLFAMFNFTNNHTKRNMAGCQNGQ